MNGRIDLCVDFEHQSTEVGQSSGLRYASTRDEEDFATRMRKKEAFRNSPQARPQRYYAVSCRDIPNRPLG